jgi:hypothetical protein
MSYVEELLKACLSASAVATVLGFFGKALIDHWLKEHVESFKQQLAEDTAIRTTLLARWRQPAYVALWKIIDVVQFGRPVELTPDIRPEHNPTFKVAYS